MGKHFYSVSYAQKDIIKKIVLYIIITLKPVKILEEYYMF